MVSYASWISILVCDYDSSQPTSVFASIVFRIWIRRCYFSEFIPLVNLSAILNACYIVYYVRWHFLLPILLSFSPRVSNVSCSLCHFIFVAERQVLFSNYVHYNGIGDWASGIQDLGAECRGEKVGTVVKVEGIDLWEALQQIRYWDATNPLV